MQAEGISNTQVERYILAGVAGLHLEDQVIAKRCGHLGNKQLVDEETYLARIRAADAARKRLGDIVIIARTDALQSLGFDAAIARLKKAVANGADVAFLEGMTTKEEMERAVKELVSDDRAGVWRTVIPIGTWGPSPGWQTINRLSLTWLR